MLVGIRLARDERRTFNKNIRPWRLIDLYHMKATMVWGMSDPITITNSPLSTVELLGTVFPGGPAKALNGRHQAGSWERVQKLAMFPDAKCYGSFDATVWIPNFAFHSSQALEIFMDAVIEHEGIGFSLRAPKLHEYLSFLSQHYVDRLVGLTSISHKKEFDESCWGEPEMYLEAFSVINPEYGDSFPRELIGFDEFCGGPTLFVLERDREQETGQ